jgi:phosphoesterase RecJ-like protein
MYELAKALCCRVNKDLAAYIYIAMLTDTGGFRYSNTTSRTMHIAAELMKSGVSPKQMYEMIYESHSLASRKLLGLSLSTLKVSPDGKSAWMYLTKAMFKRAGALPLDAENFVNYPRFIEGVKIAVLFSDNAKKGFTKVNFRSNESWADVNKIASKFGGGGHVSASGCVMKGDMKTAEKKILKEVRKVLK